MADEEQFKVFIIESSYPSDFYKNRLDGLAAQSLLNIMDVRNEFRMVLDLEHFKKALGEASAGDYEVLHLSCHGGEDGIALANNEQLDWDEFARLFQEYDFAGILVMSSCCGATSGIGRAFRKKRVRPEVIFGSTDDRTFGEYATAWALLYHAFQKDGLNRDAAQTAVSQISAVIGDTFMYRRWHDERGRYVRYPRMEKRYGVREVEDEE